MILSEEFIRTMDRLPSAYCSCMSATKMPSEACCRKVSLGDRFGIS